MNTQNSKNSSCHGDDRKICCTVENCAYHNGESTCTAKKVDVGPQFACCCQDTVCATFKPDK